MSFMLLTQPVDLMGLIGSVGFPIVACGALFYQMAEERKAFRTMLDKITEAHAKETQAYAEVIANNTLAITRLTEKLEG